MIVAGCDTGSTAALVFLRLEEVAHAVNPNRRAVTWLGSTLVRPPSSDKLTMDERDMGYMDRLAQALADFGPELLVVENPIDARASWQRQKRSGEGRSAAAAARRHLQSAEDGGIAESGETRYRQGCNYAAVLAAARSLRCKVVSYPIRGRKGRPGWQAKRTERVITLTTTHHADQWRARVPQLSTPGVGRELTAHEIMALGVLLYHLQRTENLILVP